MSFIKEQCRRVWLRTLWSWEGLRHVWQTEGSLKQWIVANIISDTLAFTLPLSAAETALICGGGILILAAECMNTAVERVVDDISTEIRPAAKQAKDTASAAVALTAVAIGVAWAIILISKL